jgi:iron complex outermembrane recepter protein
MKSSVLAPLCAHVSAFAFIAISSNVSAADDDSATTLNEVVVTAQKRSENLQEVPVAVSAFTSETRDLIGISSIQDLTNFTPGLSYSTSLDRASLRGIGRQTNNLATDPGIATYTDGFYNVSTRSAARSPLLIDRIEVLRGPQGTLYGRNSIGGTINVISKRPTDHVSGEVRAGYDNWSRINIEGTVSGPISDAVKFRLAATRTKQTEGYFKNVAGGPDEGGIEDDYYVEGQLAAKFGDVDIWLKASLAEYDNSRRASALVGDYDYARNPPSYLTLAGAYGLVLANSNAVQLGGYTSTTNPVKDNIYSFASDTPTRNKLDDNATVLAEVNWDLGPANLKYLGGFSSYYYSLVTDYDGTAVTQYTIPLLAGSPCVAPCGPVTFLPAAVQYYIEDKQYFSHEINLSSNNDGPLQWIAGLYYYDEKYQQPVYFPTANPRFANPTVTLHPGFVQTAGAVANPTTWLYYIDTHLNTTSLAGFGQLDYALNDAWKFTVGLRYSEDKKSGKELTRQICYGLSPFFGCGDLALLGTNAPASDVTDYLVSHTNPPGTTGFPVLDPATGIWSRGLSAKWSATTGTAGVAWTPVDDSMLFFKYSRGYKSGGLNTGTIVGLPLTKEETVDAFELGWKQQFGGRFQINGALFYYQYDGMQIPLSVNPVAGPPVTQYFNMDVESKGAEIETIWQATDHFQVLFNYAFLDPKVKRGQTSCCFTDNTDPLAQQPEASPSGPPSSATSQGQELANQRVPQSPRHKAALNLNYTFELSSSKVIVSASDTWKDETYFSIFNRYYNLAPSYHQVDARITWKLMDDKLDVVAFGRNVLDDLGYDGTVGSRQTQLPLGPASVGGANVPVIPAAIAQSVSLTPPRTYGVEFRYKF